MQRPTLPPISPLPYQDEAGAFELQQRLVKATTEELPGALAYTADAGVRPPLGRPDTTARVERVLAKAFGAQAACLVQGAGTGAIRVALSAGPWRLNDRRLIVHDAPDYTTTATTSHDGMVEPLRVDYNDSEALANVLAAPDSPKWLYLQHSRQKLTDSYDPIKVVELAKQAGKRVIVDENYTVVRTPVIGVERGASASAFSLFKLHGPPGVGVVLGDADIIEAAHRSNYSGGGQVQGDQALTALQQLVCDPLNWARQSQETIKLAKLLNAGAVPGIVAAANANTQDLNCIALLENQIGEQVQAKAAEFGAAPYPVGANSKYEIGPMIYRLSSSNLEEQPELKGWTLRINPMRASADLVVDILSKAINAVVA